MRFKIQSPWEKPDKVKIVFAFLPVEVKYNSYIWLEKVLKITEYWADLGNGYGKLITYKEIMRNYENNKS